MSSGINPATLKRGDQIRARSIKNSVQLSGQPTTKTGPSPRFQQLMQQNQPIHTVIQKGQQSQAKYLQQYKTRPEEEKSKHCGIQQPRHDKKNFGQNIRTDTKSGCYLAEHLKRCQKGTSSPSDRNQPKIQQSGSTLIYYLKRIADYKDIYSNQIYGNAFSEYLNPIIRMTNIVKIIEKINFEKVDVTGIIKTAYLTQEGRNMLSGYSQLKSGCVGSTREQQRQYDELKVNISKATKQLKNIQQTIQDKKREVNNLQYTINANNQHLQRAQAQLSHYKADIAHQKTIKQQLRELTEKQKKEYNKEQQRKEDIVKQRIKQQTQHKGISLLNDNFKKQYEKHVQLRDKANKQCLQYQTLRDRLSEQCRNLNKSISQIKAAIDHEGVTLAENRSLVQVLKCKEVLCDKLQKENEQLKKKINKDESFVKSVNAQVDALSQDISYKERQIVELKKQLECKTGEIREAKAEAFSLATERDNSIKQLKAQNKSLSQELKRKQHEINEYKETKEQWQKTQSELHQKRSKAQEEVKRLQLKIDDLSRENNSLQEEFRRAVLTSTDKESVLNSVLQEQKRKQETIDALQKENTILNGKIKNKQRQLRETTQKAAELHTAFEKRVVQHKALEDQIFAKDKVIDNLTQNQTALQDKLNALQIQYSDLSQKSTALTQQRDYLQNKLQTVQTEQKTRSTSIQTQLEHNQEQLVSATKTKSQFEQKIGKLEEQINLLTEQKKEHTKTVQEKDQIIKALQIKQEEGRQQLQALIKQHQKETETLRKQTKEHQTHYQTVLQDKLNDLHIQRSDLIQQIIYLTNQRDSLPEKLQIQTEHKTQPTSIQTELKNKQKQLDSIAKTKSQLDSMIGRLEKQIKALTEQKEKQIKTIQQQDELIKAMQAKNTQNDQRLQTSKKKQHQEVEHTLKKSIENLEASVKDYKTKMKRSDQAVSVLQSKHKQQIKNMEQKAQTHLIKKIAEFQGEIDKLIIQNECFTKHNDELKSQNRQLQEQLRKAKEERDQMIKVQPAVPSFAEVQTCVVLEPQFLNRSEGVQLQMAQIKEQGVECHNNDELDKALEKIKRLQNEIQEKQEQINEMRALMDEERSQMDALKSMIKESNQQEQPAQPTEEEIRRQPSQGKDLAKKLQQKENQLNDLIEGTQQLNINYNELLQEHQKLEQEHNQLKDEYKQLKQQLKYAVEKKHQVPSITLEELEKVKAELQQQLRKQSAAQLKEIQEKHSQEIKQLEEKHKVEQPEKPKDSKNQIEALKIQIQVLQKKYNDLSQQNQNNMKIVAYSSSDRQQRYLFHGEVLRTSDDYKLFIKRQIQAHMGFRIVDTRLLYRFDAYNTVNIHKYIDMIPHLVFLVKLNNGNYIATYYEGVFKSKSTADKEGIIMALNQGKCYYPIQPNRRAIIYDDYFIIFGNSEIRIKTQDKKVFSNFGLSSNYYKNNGDKVPIMLGGSDTQRQIQFEHFEVFQLIIGK